MATMHHINEIAVAISAINGLHKNNLFMSHLYIRYPNQQPMIAIAKQASNAISLER